MKRYCLRISWLRVCLAFVLLGTSAVSGFGQEASFFALQRPGQGSVAIDEAKKIAYITDLGKAGDGVKVTIGGTLLLDRLAQLDIQKLVFTCSHPHADHMGGIRALFESPQAFFTDETMNKPRFQSITVIDDGIEESLFSILRTSLGHNAAIKIDHLSARNKNAFAGISEKDEAVFIENIPYAVQDKSGVHGRSVVTHLVLGRKNSIVDFDDADSTVIRKTVDRLISTGVTSIDSFVVPHHGSAYHDIEPIFLLNPKTAIIAVNTRNPYGHPAPTVLLALMDKLGPKNVLFTGSVDNVVLGPDGVKHASYSAADEESYKLFVKPNYERAKKQKNPKDLDVFRELEVRMTAAETEPGPVRAVPTAETIFTIERDEIRAELDGAEQNNDDLLEIANKLALQTVALPKEKQQLENTIAQQAERLERLMAHFPNNNAEANQLSEERAELERLFRQIQHEPPAAVLPSPTTSPSDDPVLRGLSEAVVTGLAELATKVTNSVTSTRVVADVRYVAPLNTARAGTPEITTWTATQLIVDPQINLPYSEILSPKSSEARPGGVVMGSSGKVVAGTDLRDYVLTYDLPRKTIVLSGPEHARLIYFPPVEPQVLKALYRFAASKRNSALSLSTTSTKVIERLVRLDPAFVDTPVGIDLIASDLIGWRLVLPTLPDGRANPFASEFVDAEFSLRSCMTTSARATLIDEPTQIERSGDSIILRGGMRLEYMSDMPLQTNCPGIICKHTSNGEKVCHLAPLEKIFATNYKQIGRLFPSFERVNEYARLVGFLRWAIQSGNLAAFDLSALAEVPASDAKYRTPDALTQDSTLR